MRITKDQLKRIIREEKQRLLSELSPADMGIAAAGGGTPADQGMAAARSDSAMKSGRASGPFRHPKTGEDMFLMLNDIVDKLLDMGMNPMELSGELRGLADDVEDSMPQG